MKNLTGFVLAVALLISTLTASAQTMSDAQKQVLITQLQQLVIQLTAQLQILLAQQSTLKTPSGVEVDKTGNIISIPSSVFIQQSGTPKVPAAPLFIASESACNARSKFFSMRSLTPVQQQACLDWWLKKAPINADGGTNMPQVFYDLYLLTR